MLKLNRIQRLLLCVTLILTGFGARSAASRADASSPLKPLLGIRAEAAPTDQSQTTDQKLIGNWLGVLDAGAVKLRLVLKITADADNKPQAVVDSIDQNITDLRVDKISYTGSSVHFEMANIGGVYNGTLSSDGMEMSGQWKQGMATMPLVFKRVAKLPVIKRPQEPAKPYPYIEEEISYENKRDGVKLAGTLTIPRERGPHPAVILITGSGPQDRDEAMVGHRPFLVLADYLTRRGIAVLRTDDRGVGGSTPGKPTDTVENYAGDVLAGVEFLKQRAEIDPKQIGLAGHSEGGLVAPMVAAQSPDAAFIVLLAGPGIPGERLAELQNVAMLKAAGAGDELIAQAQQLLKLILSALKKEKLLPDDERKLHEEASKIIAGMPEGLRSTAERQFKMLAAGPPSLRYNLAYDPRRTLIKVRVPVLAIGGELDLQVPPVENLEAISQALQEGGNKDFKTIQLPRLNHLLQTSRTGSFMEMMQIEETIAPAALELIADWIIKHTRHNRPAPKEK